METQNIHLNKKNDGYLPGKGGEKIHDFYIFQGSVLAEGT